MLVFSDCSTAIRDAPRHVVSTPRNVVGARRHVVCAPKCVVGAPRYSLASHQYSQMWHRRSQVLEGALKVLSGPPKCSQTYPNHSPHTPVQVIRDSCHSVEQPECPPMVVFSADIDSSKVTLHILSDTVGGFQWLKYILLMKVSSGCACR